MVVKTIHTHYESLSQINDRKNIDLLVICTAGYETGPKTSPIMTKKVMDFACHNLKYFIKLHDYPVRVTPNCIVSRSSKKKKYKMIPIFCQNGVSVCHSTWCQFKQEGLNGRFWL